ncbi:hypothetical protein IE077_001210, partial [Cardiosporidium cionae]
MPDELKLRFQDVRVRVDFARQTLEGAVSLQVQYTFSSSLTSPQSYFLPLQVPSQHVDHLTAVYIDSQPIKWKYHSQTKKLAGLVPDSTAPLITWDLALKCLREVNQETIILLEIPSSLAEKVALVSSKKFKKRRKKEDERLKFVVRIDVLFKLKELIPQESPLFFMQQHLRKPDGDVHYFHSLQMNSQVDTKLAWFPTVPQSGYPSSRCNWKCIYEVPLGYTAVGPGNLIERRLSSCGKFESFHFDIRGNFGKLYPHEICIFVGKFVSLSGNRGVEFPITAETLSQTMDTQAYSDKQGDE